MRCKKCAASPALLGASAGAAAAAAAGVDRDGLGSGDGGAGLGIRRSPSLWAQGEGLSIYQVVSSQKSEVSCKLQAPSSKQTTRPTSAKSAQMWGTQSLGARHKKGFYGGYIRYRVKPPPSDS